MAAVFQSAAPRYTPDKNAQSFFPILDKDWRESSYNTLLVCLLALAHGMELPRYVVQALREHLPDEFDSLRNERRRRVLDCRAHVSCNELGVRFRKSVAECLVDVANGVVHEVVCRV